MSAIDAADGKSEIVIDMLEDVEAQQQVIVFMNIVRSTDPELDSVRALEHGYSLCTDRS